MFKGIYMTGWAVDHSLLATMGRMAISMNYHISKTPLVMQIKYGHFS